MGARFTDAEIAILLNEEKRLPENYSSLIELKSKKGHKEREIAITGGNGNAFLVILRQSEINSLDFSVILGYQLPKSNVVFRLRRYNGKSHEHSNRIEGDVFYGFHVHAATQRYQELGMDEDSYARPSDQYSNIQQALGCLFSDCGFAPLPDDQLNLF